LVKSATLTSIPATGVVSLKVTLEGLRPPIWRRVLVPGAITLGGLSEVILAAMGWDGGHLHAFNVAGRRYGDPGLVDDVADEDRMTLNGLIKAHVKRFTYTYDFGDGWEHIVAIEKIQPATYGQGYPLCVAGKRNCPPEDCGGVWGYAELMEILADPAHPERAERVEWLGGEDFDPEAFDIERTNARLAAPSE
jgi:Plasmid pRiA4b ORF-3-like protein